MIKHRGTPQSRRHSGSQSLELLDHLLRRSGRPQFCHEPVHPSVSVLERPHHMPPYRVHALEVGPEGVDALSSEVTLNERLLTFLDEVRVVLINRMMVQKYAETLRDMAVLVNGGGEDVIQECRIETVLPERKRKIETGETA